MKQLLAMILAVMLVLGATVCFADETKEFGVAWICEVLNESNNLYCNAWKAALQKADEADDSFRFTSIDIFDAQNDVSTQIATIENCVSSGKYDLLAINPVDPVGLAPAYETAIEAGVIVLDIGHCQTEAKSVDITALDEPSQGKNMKAYLAKYLDEHPDAVFNMCLMEGLPETLRCLPRLQYIREELAVEYADRVHILTEGWGLWNTEKAATIAEDWMQAYPELNMICCADDTMAVGVVNAIIAAGRGGEILVVGFNGDDGVLGFIRDGQMLATSGNYAGLMSKNYAQLTLDCLLGNWDMSVKEYNMGASVLELVDASNVDQFTADKYTKAE